ncbi:hypothetical protein [Polluticoccus soli]|uniref:hypothetical protein n=1 Tax=Polluticoccus soli TaxID=3034150 RepID=UPI0023E140D4|nr:hypothetical protein [Flavipsychrobacter sp. JY13-12]
MKKAILSALLLSLGVTVFAQEAKEETPATRKLPEFRKHELGIMQQSGGNDLGVNLVGAQYKTWRDEHHGLRFIAAYGNHNSFASSIVSLGSDSLTEVHSVTKVNMPVIGMGFEMQRHFWRSVYFSAAVDVWGGYGSGNVDTFSSTRHRTAAGPPTNTYGASFIPQDVSMSMVGIAPSVGAKILTNRVAFNLELMPVQMVFKSLNYEKAPSSSLFNFDAGMYLSRLSVSYRF